MTSLAPPTTLRLQGSVSTESAADLALAGDARVLAVFEQAAYLLFDHGHAAVVALLRRGALQLPNGIRLLGQTAPDLRTVLAPGDRVLTGTDELGVGQVRAGAVAVSLIGTHQPTRVQTRPGFVLDPDDLDALGAAPSLRSRARTLAAGLEADDPRGLDDLVGWGQGLTPTGDDVICGVLLALVATERLEPVHALDLLGGRGQRTTSLSARMLLCATRGLAVPQVVALVDALLAPGSRPTTSQVRAVHAIGHSSGRDLCAGLAGALDHVAETPTPDTHPSNPAIEGKPA